MIGFSPYNSGATSAPPGSRIQSNQSENYCLFWGRSAASFHTEPAHNPESAELDAALTEYAELREQAQGVDPIQLYEVRQVIRPCKKQEAENRAQQVYGEKYSPLLMFDSKKTVSRMLHEDIERQAIRRMVQQADFP